MEEVGHGGMEGQRSRGGNGEHKRNRKGEMEGRNEGPREAS